MKNSILLSSVAFLFYAATALGQGGNTGHFSVTGEFLGWDGTGTVQSLNIRNNFNQPINFFTNNLMRATFTTGNAFGTGSTQGDGLRIFDTSGGPGHLDLWTSSSTQTHIRWNGSGTIQGMNSRLEM